MIAESRKALMAALVAFLGPLAVLLSTVGPLTGEQWALAVVSGLVAALSTYLVPNRPSAMPPAADPGPDDTPAGRHAAI